MEQVWRENLTGEEHKKTDGSLERVAMHHQGGNTPGGRPARGLTGTQRATRTANKGDETKPWFSCPHVNSFPIVPFLVT